MLASTRSKRARVGPNCGAEKPVARIVSTRCPVSLRRGILSRGDADRGRIDVRSPAPRPRSGLGRRANGEHRRCRCRDRARRRGKIRPSNNMIQQQQASRRVVPWMAGAERQARASISMAELCWPATRSRGHGCRARRNARPGPGTRSSSVGLDPGSLASTVSKAMCCADPRRRQRGRPVSADRVPGRAARRKCTVNLPASARGLIRR